jgi:hypothetical protein
VWNNYCECLEQGCRLISLVLATSKSTEDRYQWEIPSRPLRTAQYGEGMTGRVVAEGGGGRFLFGPYARHGGAKEGRIWVCRRNNYCVCLEQGCRLISLGRGTSKRPEDRY